MTTAAGASTAAWTALYAAQAPKVRSLLAYRMGVPDADADDLTADVFLRAWQHRGRYEDRGVNVQAWLMQIARNALVDQYRQRTRRPTIPLALVPEPTAADTLADADSRLLRRQIVQAMTDLTALQQRVLVLRFLRGLDVRETAVATGVSEDAVKQLQRRGLANLRRALACPCGCWQLTAEVS